MARKPTDYLQFKLRIRESLRRKIERAAEKKAISANAEAVERLEQTFEQEDLWEQQHKEMEEHREEIEAQERAWHEEQARERAIIDAALKNSEVLNVLVGGDENAKLLRLMILGMGNNPDWAATPESQKIFADKVHQFLVSADIKKGISNEGTS